ncbi:DM13 domain-containing protein [Streptomyces roseicoloratus]|uniref:DM13 domain-containing protein n=1 Tax=Streptomyces roseicoloratus TaxID=2508722 RepID=UPI001009A95C|nr:DM13 domain-containing protein [Streptomyces roseicoloratus]
MSRVSRRGVIGAFLAATALVLGVGLAWFQPWKLWVDDIVREALPAAAAPATAPTATAPTGPAPTGTPGTGPVAVPPAAPQTVASGELISHEHHTTGTVRILRLPDGSHTLRLENLDTSNGPDLRVWLTDAPVKEGVAGWRVFDDGRHLSLGSLKGNKGDQNYALPAGTDLGAYTSVSIWCDRFDVSFGAAALTRV